MTYIIRQDDISVMPLSGRSKNALRRIGIHTIGAMIDYPADKLINNRFIGVKSAEEIRGCIQLLTHGTGEYVLVKDFDQIFDKGGDYPENIDANHAPTAFFCKSGAIVRDIPVKNLALSTRAKNSLTRSGYEFASQLVGVTCEKLMHVPNMGRKTAEEVLEYITKISVVCRDVEGATHNKAVANLVEEMCVAYGGIENVWLREVLAVMTQFPETIGESFIYCLYDRILVRRAARAKILQIIDENNNKISKMALEEKLPQHLNNTTIIKDLLLELEIDSVIEIGEVMICRQCPTVMEYTAQIENNRIRGVIQERLTGKTLSEIGEQFGISGERVRQLIEKGLRKKPRLREDKYTYLYDNYNFSLEDFILAFDEPNETYYYLEMISQTARIRRKPLDEILTDTSITPECRKKAERAIDKVKFQGRGQKSPKNRNFNLSIKGEKVKVE